MLSSNAYTNTKIFHYPEKLNAIRDGRVTPPIHIRLKPTNRCNHNCAYCCFRNADLLVSERMDQRDEIPPAKMQELIADVGAMGVRAVTLSGGGEPLCYPEILGTVRGLLEQGVSLALLTNGSRLTGEVAEILAREATWVRVSMDAADREAYARGRRVSAGEFDKVCENIRNFTQISGRKCALGVNFVVTRENSEEVLTFLVLLKALGADHVKVSEAVISTDPREEAAYMASFYESVREQLAKAQATLADPTFSIVDRFHMPVPDELGYEKRYTTCPFVHCLTVIGADQNVYTCQDKAYTTAGLLGSIKDKRFAELWASDELKQRLLGINPSCDCSHHCVAHDKNVMLHDYFAADTVHMPFV